MKRYLLNRFAARRHLRNFALAACLALPLPALAATVALATEPLATSTSSSVRPNVMFILDDSGSMEWDYLPDWADDSDPTSGLYPSSGIQYSRVPALHRNSSFNGVAYNPAITYTPPVLYNADGTLNTTTYPSITSGWSSVKNDAFGKISTSSTDLLASFPDVEWCTDWTYTDCLRNDNLLLPDSITVGGVTKNYKTTHSKVSSGTGNVATGSPDAPTTAARTFGPFYYTIVPAEYCDSANLKNCQTTETSTFKYAAPLRWCNSSALTTCQAIWNSTYKYPRYPTLVLTPEVPYQAAVPAQPAVEAVAGVAASASFTFNYSGSLNPVGFSIKVNGTEMLNVSTPGALMTNSQLAAWVQSHSSLTGYAISASGSTVTVTATTTGTAKNISSVVITEIPGTATYTTNPSLVSGATAVAGVYPTGLITFGPTGTTRSSSTPRINDSLFNSQSIRVGNTNVYANDIDPGNSKTATQVAATVVSKVGTGGTVKAYIGGNAVTPTCAAQPSNVVCLVDTSTYTNNRTVSVGSRSNFNTLGVSTSSTTGGSAAVAATYAKGTITFNYPGALNPTGMSLNVNGTEVLTTTTPGALTTNSAIDDWIRLHSSLANYVITSSGSTVTFTANAVGPAWNISSISYSQNPPDSVTYTGPTMVAGVDEVIGHDVIPETPEVPYQPATYYGSFIRTDIVPADNSYPYPGTATKANTRTDCAGTTCTYAEEMTNFANWWTYYHTRMQAMKSSVSRSFKTIDDRFRVGFSTITYTGATDGTTFLGNDTFELDHKNKWFTKLFGTDAPYSTALRRALSKAGRYYANKISGQVDPVQYSCQQNFTILSTDGYWNDSSSEAKDLNGNTIPDMDASPTPRPMYEGPTATSPSLADIAKYYYDTDLRTSTLSNCTGGSSLDFPSGTDVCKNNVFTSSSDNNIQQHMTTFTMGLGIDGTLVYTSDYQDATSGDYYDLYHGIGSVNWSDPINKSAGERIDDLWHAAVNGQGIYFSAKNPDQIVTGFNKALSSITTKLGSAAAAATSTLNPVAGNNYAYVASYTTVKWFGNLEARKINIDDGAVSKTATWCVEDVLAETCTSPGTIAADTSGSSTIYNCVVTGTTASACASPGVFDAGTSTCKTEITNSCTGKLASQVGATSDTRNIYTANNAGTALIAFDADYATANPTNFSSTHISGLNQWGTLTIAQQTAAAGVNLINYLRGQSGYEDRAANTTKLYRAREAVLGDALESQPFFISGPSFSYPYPGYGAFKADKASRGGAVYMGTNDGMMHAFNSDDGSERWAYVPSMVIPNMWILASTSYDINHTNFVNGSPNVADVCTANCDSSSAVWKTILVSGLNGGGRGYFALDVTDPNTPKLLWEFTPSTGAGVIQDDDLGYSFAQPIIARKNDGSWVVLVTSGYNNVSPGSGKGFLFVLNAGSGAIVSKIATGVGDTTTPSGLAKIDGYNEEPAGNKIGFVYGGDLLGNLWRFDVNSDVTATVGKGDVLKFATLYADTGASSPQPITTTPILAKIGSKRQIFISTGKYLEKADLSTTQVQSLYSIRDDDESTTLVNPRTTLVKQTLTNSGSSASRTSTANPVDYSTKRGCYADYPDVGERANIDSSLVKGILLAPTIVPENTPCSPGGYGWLNYFDYENCGTYSVGDIVGVKSDSTIVGVNVIYIHGDPLVEIVTSTNPTPEKPKGNQPDFSRGSGSGFTGRRVIWRELIPE
jgi:type IV pilus assembly protein PilY1